MRGPSWFRAKAGRRDSNQRTLTKALDRLKYFYVDCAGIGGGVPDLLVYDRASNPVWVEVKTLKGKLRDSQREFIARLDARGIHHGVARTVEELLALLGHDAQRRVTSNAERARMHIEAEVARIGREAGERARETVERLVANDGG